MHVSLHLSPQSRGPEEDQSIIDALVAQARAADSAGFAAVYLTEHHGGGFNTYSDPFMLGAHLAATIRRAYIAVTVAQVALYHPLRLVEHSNLLDILTRGRCLIGLAAGSASAFELDAFGIDIGDRVELTRQRIESMLTVWGRERGDPPLDISTNWDAGVLRTRVSPTSHRRPHPLLARVTATDATVVAAAQAGWPVILGAWEGGTGDDLRLALLYREALAAAGHSAEVVGECLAWLGFFVGVCIADTQEEAQRRYDEHVRIGGSGPIPGRHGAPEASAEEWTMRAVGRAGISVIGTPDTVTEHLLSIKAAGINHVRIAFVETSGQPEQAVDSFKLFADEVLPHLDPQPLPEPPPYEGAGGLLRNTTRSALSLARVSPWRPGIPRSA
jgi:alkanesulfonate monooxygenase SsuD/methylene tetrahydromethanopterin reductase-like flavin-dependent oxidoreductase (luciferase family)